MVRDFTDPNTVVFGRTLAEYAAELEALTAKLLRPVSGVIDVGEGRYAFPALPYRGGVVDVYFDLKLACDAQNEVVQKDFAGWQEYVRSGNIILDQQFVFQIGRRLLRAEQTPEVVRCTQRLRAILDSHYIHSGVGLSYGRGLVTTVSCVDLEGKLQTKFVEVSEFTKDNPNDSWSYLVLARENPAGQNMQAVVIPETVKPFLSLLFGEGYEEAGAVFQYLCSPKTDGTLREMRLYVPSSNNRPIERALVFGRYGNDRINILCDNIIINSWPAVSGGRGAPKIP